MKDMAVGQRDDGEGLGTALSALEADPGNLHAWLRVATLLADDGEAGQADREQARQALDSVAVAFAEAGHLPMAILSCLRLSQRAEGRQSWARLLVLGNMYGRTSSRLDPAIRPRPPSPPRMVPTTAEVLPAPAMVLRVRAVSALRKAMAQAVTDQQMAATRSRQLHEPLPVVPLFSALLPESFVKLAQQLSEQDLPAGARIFSAGEPGDCLYILCRGTVRIELDHGQAESKILVRLRPGAFFGEMALLTTTRRLAHAIAETPVSLLRITKAQLEQLSAGDDSIGTALAEHARRRLLQDVVMTSQLFRGFPKRTRERIIEHFTFRTYEPGEVVIKDGQPGRDLFVVLSGKAEVARRQSPEQSVLYPVATLSMGDVIGEMALLADRPTSALVHALERLSVLALRREDFEAVVAEVPEVRERLSQLAAERLGSGAPPEEGPAARLPLPDDEEHPDLLV